MKVSILVLVKGTLVVRLEYLMTLIGDLDKLVSSMDLFQIVMEVAFPVFLSDWTILLYWILYKEQFWEQVYARYFSQPF